VVVWLPAVVSPPLRSVTVTVTGLPATGAGSVSWKPVNWRSGRVRMVTVAVVTLLVSLSSDTRL